MAINRGKQFEDRLKTDWENTFPSSLCLRLPDQVSRYKDASKNICDFVMFKTPRAFLIEAKTVTGNTFSIQSKSMTTGQMETFRQYPLLLQKKNIPNLFAGVMLWFQKHDKVIWVPIEELEKMINDDLRSINIKMLKENKYKMIEIPSVKMRVFMKSDYSIMMNIEKE